VLLIVARPTCALMACTAMTHYSVPRVGRRCAVGDMKMKLISGHRKATISDDRRTNSVPIQYRRLDSNFDTYR
jgi:hypothetical protein